MAGLPLRPQLVKGQLVEDKTTRTKTRAAAAAAAAAATATKSKSAK